MSSTHIVQDSRTLIQNTLLEVVPTKWLPQVTFGVEAFSLRPFQSAASNARAVVENRHTANSKTRRLLANVRLAEYFSKVFDQLKLVKPSSYLNVDHSDFDGLTALVGAIQTRQGRAVPAMVDTTYAHHIPSDMSWSSTPRWRRLRQSMTAARRVQSFTGHTIDTLQNLADRLGFWPRLVFDRGFGNESIICHLVAEAATFYLRLKGGRYVELDGERTDVRHLESKDATISLYGLTLRVIRSPKSRRAPEPWYILTNDFVSSRGKVVSIYYHRFEIEETFKDTKHLFELHQLRFEQPNSLKVILWLIFLGLAVLYVVTRSPTCRLYAGNPKKYISWVRRAYEQFARELTARRNLTGLAA